MAAIVASVETGFCYVIYSNNDLLGMRKSSFLCLKDNCFSLQPVNRFVGHAWQGAGLRLLLPASVGFLSFFHLPDTWTKKSAGIASAFCETGIL